jgi:hypothetical protein
LKKLAISNDEFVYEYKEVPQHLLKGPKWKVLTGTKVVLPEGFNPSGVTEGFFSPTNQENAIGQKKLTYLTDSPISR